jgi:hypothetical protein
VTYERIARQLRATVAKPRAATAARAVPALELLRTEGLAAQATVGNRVVARMVRERTPGRVLMRRELKDDELAALLGLDLPRSGESVDGYVRRVLREFHESQLLTDAEDEAVIRLFAQAVTAFDAMSSAEKRALPPQLMTLARPRARATSMPAAAPAPPRFQTYVLGTGFPKAGKGDIEKGLLPLLREELQKKGDPIDVAAHPRKHDQWIKITEQQFADGPRVDLEEHKPDGENPRFQRVRMQGNKRVGFYGGLLWQVGCSYPLAEIVAAFEQAIRGGVYVVVHDGTIPVADLPH